MGSCFKVVQYFIFFLSPGEPIYTKRRCRCSCFLFLFFLTNRSSILCAENTCYERSIVCIRVENTRGSWDFCDFQRKEGRLTRLYCCSRITHQNCGYGCFWRRRRRCCCVGRAHTYIYVDDSLEVLELQIKCTGTVRDGSLAHSHYSYNTKFAFRK